MVSIVTCTNRNGHMANVFHNYSHQEWVKKELIVVLNGDNMKLREWRRQAKQYSNVTVYQLPAEDSLGQCLNFAVDKAKYDIIAKFDDDDYYSPYYISQAMHVFKTKQADVVGKKKIFTYFQRCQKLGIRSAKMAIAGPTIMFRKKVHDQVRFPSRNVAEDSFFLRKAKKNQFKIYTTNPYNFVYIRSAKENHTWQLANKQLMKQCFDLKVTDNYIPCVTKLPKELNVMAKNETQNHSSGVLPDFLIIGTQKGGSSSLYHYLIKHPDIQRALRKELHFFNKTERYNKGLDWYKKQLPLSKSSNPNKVTGEATPNYLFNPSAPKRIAKDLPQTTKFIVLLRNPVDRAYSNYQMKVGKGHDQRSFEKAIIHDETRLEGEFQHIIKKYENERPDQTIYPYVTRGIYVEQLKTWMDLFPRDQFLIVKSEDLFNEPEKVVNQVVRFLGLDENKLNVAHFRTFNKGTYHKTMNPQTRKILLDYYRPYNRRLENFLDMKFNWDE